MNNKLYKILAAIMIILGLTIIGVGVYKIILNNNQNSDINNDNIDNLPIVDAPITNEEAKTIVLNKYNELLSFMNSETGFGGLDVDTFELNSNDFDRRLYYYAPNFIEEFNKIFVSDVKYNMVFGELDKIDEVFIFDSVDNGDNYYSYVLDNDKYYIDNKCYDETDYLHIDIQNGELSFSDDYKKIIYTVNIYSIKDNNSLVKTVNLELLQEDNEWKLLSAVTYGNCDRVLYINQVN